MNSNKGIFVLLSQKQVQFTLCSMALSILIVPKYSFSFTDEEFHHLKMTVERLQAQSTIQGSGAHEIPVGTILPFAGNEHTAIPEGYFPCDGRWLKSNDAPMLFAFIGDTYSKTKKEGEFQLPDLRGRVLKGENNIADDTTEPNVTPTPTPSETPTAGSTSHEDKPKDENGNVLKSTKVGDYKGNQTVKLTANQIPEHKHSGTTEEDGDHKHKGTTYNAGNHFHIIEGKWGSGLGGWTLSANSNGRPGGHHGTTWGGEHQHSFETGVQDKKHKHTFNTTENATRQNESFSVLNPSLTVRFIIKYK